MRILDSKSRALLNSLSTHVLDSWPDFAPVSPDAVHVISQYANSPIITQICYDISGYFRQDINTQVFYDTIWNIDTAIGYGLDVWGKIVNIGRFLEVRSHGLFGFDGTTHASSFGTAPFSLGPAGDTTTLTLDDGQYRTLIMIKALANITRTTAPAINALLRALFKDRGRCYVVDLGGMAISYYFEFALTDIERAIMTGTNLMPHGAGVAVSIIESYRSFGFAGTPYASPFGIMPFFAG